MFDKQFLCFEEDTKSLKKKKKKEGDIGPQTVMAHWNGRMC